MSFTCFVCLAVRGQQLALSDFALLEVSRCLWGDLPAYFVLSSPPLQTQSVEWTAKNVDFPFPWWTIITLGRARYQEEGCVLGELNRKWRARVENTVSTAEANQQFSVYVTSWFFSQVGRYLLWLHCWEQSFSRGKLLQQLDTSAKRLKKTQQVS